MMLKALPLKKITLLGTTGAGKTTLLQALFGDFQKNDVRRDVRKEKNSNLDFTPLKDNNFAESTTTISFNVITSIFARTLFNKVLVKKIEEISEIDFGEIEEAYKTIFADPAGQDRFSFMQDIVIKGSHLVIIMSDGTNIASVEKIPQYIRLVEAEEKRAGRKIPIVIFVNKSDLRAKGLFLGAEVAERVIAHSGIDRDIVIYETSNLHKKSLEEPLALIYNFLMLTEQQP